LELICRNCGTKTPEELGFCTNCRRRLFPRTKFDLIPADFTYPPDLSAIESIKVTGPLPYIVKRLALANYEKTLVSNLSVKAHKVSYPSQVDLLARQCAMLLAIDFLPEIFIIDGGPPNAFTFGSEEQAYLVMDSSLFEALTPTELMAVIAHELGHVKSGHMMYHTLAEALGSGINLSASLMGLGMLAIPVRLALLSWHRESEVTADRTSLLAVNDIQVLHSLLWKLGSSRGVTSLDQPRNQEQRVGMLEAVGELFRTHPLDSNRFKLAKEFWQSQEFLRARQKIQRRQSLLRALVPVCRFCGQSKSAEDLFCLQCGRCQT